MAIGKRVIPAAICAGLITVGAVVGMGTNSTYGGAGKGADTKVKDLETMKEVVESVSERQHGRQGYSVGGASEDGHDSFTVIETSNVYVTASISGDRNSDSTLSFSRTLSMYYGVDASYYESEVLLSSSSSISTSGWSSKTKSTLNMKVKIYLSEESAMLYICRLNYFEFYEYEDYYSPDENKKETKADTLEGKQMDILKEYCNRWIDCSESPDAARSFLEINNNNLESLSDFSRLLGNSLNSEEKNFKKNGDVYQLKENALLDFFGLSSYKDDADIKGKLSVDLSSATKPELYYDLSVKTEGSASGIRYVHVDDSYLFKNIDNTVVKKPKVKGVDITEINDRMDEIEEDD